MDNLRTQIIGGIIAKPLEFPYQVGIKFRREFHIFCGGAIIDEYWILTAAHCVKRHGKPIDADRLEAIAGVTNPYDERGIIAPVIEIYIHESYSQPSNEHPNFKHENDIALIKTNVSLIRDENGVKTSIIPLAEGNDDFAGQKAVIAGWGLRSTNRYVPKPLDLYTTEFIIETNDTCSNYFVWRNYDHFMFLCGGDSDSSACFGDSGGPLVVREQSTGEKVVVGVASHGQAPDVCDKIAYTRVSSYRDWIEKIKRTYE